MNSRDYDPIAFKIGFGAVQHFGKNLYTTNPPAIAELIANGWDAYAKKVQILFTSDNKSDNYLIVADNGYGMNYRTLVTRYAVSGLPKPSNEVTSHPNDMEPRPIMGRKGIGKFAAFSLGDEYYIITRDSPAEPWISLKLEFDYLYNEGMTKAEVEVNPTTYSEEELNKFLPDSFINIPDKGTIIYIPKLRHRLITTSVDSLTKLLARRFAANLFSSHEFELSINNDIQDLKKQFYDSEIQFVHYFGLDEVGIEELNVRFSSAKVKEDKTNDFFTKNGISGWLGSVLEPRNLKIENQGDGAGIVVYINGKLADENVLSNNQNQNIAAQYIVGEIQADYLQTEEIDPITSSRQGLNHALSEVETFVAEIAKARNYLVSKWKEYRGGDKKTPWYNPLHAIPQFESMYKSLPQPEQHHLDVVASEVLENKKAEDAERYYPIILSFGLTQTIESVSQSIAEITSNGALVETFRMLFTDLHLDDALIITRTISNRLDVINMLEADTQENVLESVLEDVLAKNPWLIDPTWQGVPISQQNRFNYKLETGQEQRGRSDILVYTNEVSHNNFPVIVELKRAQGHGHQTPTVNDVLTQIDKYRSGLVDQRSQQDGSFDQNSFGRLQIPAYFVAGSNALLSYNSSDREIFKMNNIKLLSFTQIVNNARSLYSNIINNLN